MSKKISKICSFSPNENVEIENCHEKILKKKDEYQNDKVERQMYLL